jgi:hypothetical protein
MNTGENFVSANYVKNEEPKRIDILEVKKGDVYILGDIYDEENDKIYKFVEENEDDMNNKKYKFIDVNNGEEYFLEGYILRDTSIYDVTKAYNKIQNLKKLEMSKEKYGKDIASNIGEYLGVDINDIRDMYRRGGGDVYRRRNVKKRTKKTLKYKSRKNKCKRNKSKMKKSIRNKRQNKICK